MEGRRPKLRIVKRHQRHWFRVPSTQTVVLTSLVLLSVAIDIGRFQQGEIISFLTERTKTFIFEHFRIEDDADQILHTDLKKFVMEVSNLPRIWTNPQLHFTYWTRLPLFLLILSGWKHLKELVKITGCIFRLRNKNTLGVILILTAWAVLVVYSLVPMFCDLCVALTQHILSLSVVEVNSKYMAFSRSETPHQDVAPYFTINLTKYNMEDVIMACRFVVISEGEASRILKSFRWIKDDVHTISETERIHIATTVYRFNTGSTLHIFYKFLIESKLTISFLDDADYGKYSCRYSLIKGWKIFPHDESQFYEQIMIPFLIHENFISPYKPKIDGIQSLQVIVETFSNFHLQKRIMPIHEVIIPPGGLLIEHVPYWSLADPGDIIINETVWDKNNDECCSWSARLYKFLFGYRKLVWREKFNLGRQRYLIKHKCVCVEDFALKNKTFSIIRYNSTSKRQQVISIHYPQQLILVPYIPNIFNIKTDKEIAQSLLDDFIACSNGSDTSPVCKRRLESTKDMSTSASKYNLYFHIVCFIILFILSICVFRLCFKWLWTYLISPAIRFAMDPLPVERHLPPCYDHDLYMTYDETDEYEREVAQRLKHRLEITGYRVFDACEDILPGFPELHAREEAIRSSALFCLIISTASQNDGQTILEHTAIKQTLADRKATGTETEDCKFVIQIGDCPNDGFLIPGNVIVSESERQNYELVESVEPEFFIWAICSITDIRSFDLFKLLSIYGFSIWPLVIIVLILHFLENWVGYFWPLDVYRQYILSSEKTKLVYEPENWPKN